MTALAAIRTHRWGPAEERLFARLHPVFGDRLVVVFHNRPKDLPLPLEAVDIDDGFLSRHQLLRTDDWGWRCGDYSFYAVREARPQFDHYWLIEPDVHFTSLPDSFFAAFEDATEDGFASRVETPRDQGRFAVALGDLRLTRATFALTRLSGRAIDMLLVERQAMHARGIGHRFWPNDEFFVWSVLSATPGITVGSLETRAADWFDGTSIVPSPDHLLEAVEATVPPGRVIHPVHDREGFARAIERRFVDAAIFLTRHRASLAYLSETELDRIAFRVGQVIRAELQRNRDAYLSRKRRQGQSPQ